MGVPKQTRREDPPGGPSGRTTGAEALARFYWMFAGNAAVGFLAMSIARHAQALSWRDLAYWGAVASLIAVRFVDIARLGGATADGEPATPAHWRRYSALLVLICGLGWAAAHGIALVATR